MRVEALPEASGLKASFFAALCVLCLVVKLALASPGCAVSRLRRLLLVRPAAVCTESKHYQTHISQSKNASFLQELG